MGARAWVLALILITVAPALSGCLDTGSDEAVEQTAVRDAADLLAHRAGELVAVPDGYQDLSYRLSHTGFHRGEPTVGVTSTGTIFATAGPAAAAGGQGQIARSTDHGQSWELVTDPVFSPKVSLDPWLWVDPLTDRVFNSPLYVACSWVAFSDDEGESWRASPLGGCGIPAHDHQKLTTGPPPEGVTTMGYPNIVYYQYNSFRQEGTIVSRSLDGGLTWSPGAVAHPSDCFGGIAGPTGVAPDGTAFSPKPTCGGVRVAASTDGGESWQESATITQAGIAPFLVTLDIDVDPDGNPHVAYQGEDGQVYLARSADGGQGWLDPVRVSPPQLNATVFAAIAVGETGRATVAYLGTQADTSTWGNGVDPSEASDGTVWHLYLSSTEDALADQPTWTTVRATPEEDPVQRGCIWLRGGSNDCRNLRDFIDAVEHEGRVYVAYADGCDGCESAEGSRERGETVVAIQETGPSLVGTELSPLPTTSG